MDRLLLILAYFLASMFLASCSSECDTCELPPSKFQNFDIDSFIGKSWYAYTVAPPTIIDKWTCWTNTYQSCNGSYYMYANLTDESLCKPRQMTAALQVKTGNAIEMKFLANPEFNYAYFVYGTDYKTYAVQGGCPEVLEGEYVVWISYTSWYPTKAAQKDVKSVLKKNGLDHYEYVRYCNNIPKQQ